MIVCELLCLYIYICVERIILEVYVYVCELYVNICVCRYIYIYTSWN
jgi:hypothetical protein